MSYRGEFRLEGHYVGELSSDALGDMFDWVTLESRDDTDSSTPRPSGGGRASARDGDEEDERTGI